MITARAIQESLLHYFNSHKYQLFNSYVFNWECDYFSMPASGFAYEVEIKISRSDFLADFKKDKHQLFTKQLQGVPGYWINEGRSYHGERIGIVKYKVLDFGYPDRHKGKTLDPGVIYDWQKRCYVTNQWDKYSLREKQLILHAPATRIRYMDLSKVHFPNRFYYCCPTDLIKPNEVPKYAGLYYCDGFSIAMIKKAPLLTKRLMDLKGVLLEKFYYECVKLRSQVTYKTDSQ